MKYNLTNEDIFRIMFKSSAISFNPSSLNEEERRILLNFISIYSLKKIFAIDNEIHNAYFDKDSYFTTYFEDNFPGIYTDKYFNENKKGLAFNKEATKIFVDYFIPNIMNNDDKYLNALILELEICDKRI